MIAHRIHHHMGTLGDLFKAVRATVAELEGAYALVVLSETEPDRLILARMGCPVVIGLGEHENFVASDVAALLPVTRRFQFLEEGDIAEVRRESVRVVDARGQHASSARSRRASCPPKRPRRGRIAHFMLKEIHEQPRAVANTLQERVAERPAARGRVRPQGRRRVPARRARAHRRLRHQLPLRASSRSISSSRSAGIPCSVEIASEYRYRNAVVPQNSLFVTISQSGETADTLAALRLAKQSGYLATLAICNSPESSLVRESDLVMLTRAGPEIGVASTKAFTTQITALSLLVVALAKHNGADAERERGAGARG